MTNTATPSTTDELLTMVRASGICTADLLEQRLRGKAALPAAAEPAAAVLVQLGVLTRFQAKLLLAGRSRGFKLGPYVIKEQLGRGGMGAVYLAEHETLRRRVALKVLTPPKEETDTKLAVERFLREARSAAAVDHPNIVRLHDVGRHGEINYLVMEYVEGETLEALVLKGGAIPTARAVGYIAQAAAGLQHAHEEGFVHRDIKPANLIVAKGGTVKILDMGLARSFTAAGDKLTEVMDRGAILGTSDYIAPEQALGDPDVDVRADIYSLGATFFALVTGRPPFSGNTAQKLLQHQMKEAPSLADIDPTFPEDLSDVVATMMAKKPADRYQTPAEVIAALTPWLAKDGGKVAAGLSGTAAGSSAAMKKTLSKTGSRSTRRHRKTQPLIDLGRPTPAGWAVVGGAVAAAIILGVVLVLSLGGSKPAAPVAAAPVVVGPGGGSPARPPATRGDALYRLDPATIPEFRSRYLGMSPEPGEPFPSLPQGVRIECYKPGSRGLFGCGPVDGAPALWVTNLTDIPTTQYSIELEDECRCPLEPGREYTVRVEYHTQGAPEGHVHVQTKQYKWIEGNALSPAETGWRVGTVRFRRQDEPVRLTFGIRGGGADKSIFFRFVEVIPTP